MIDKRVPIDRGSSEIHALVQAPIFQVTAPGWSGRQNPEKIHIFFNFFNFKPGSHRGCSIRETLGSLGLVRCLPSLLQEWHVVPGAPSRRMRIWPLSTHAFPSCLHVPLMYRELLRYWKFLAVRSESAFPSVVRDSKPKTPGHSHTVHTWRFVSHDQCLALFCISLQNDH